MNRPSEPGMLMHFTAYGIPAAQGSKRHIGGGRMIEMNKNLPAWRKAVAEAAHTAQTAQNGPWEPINMPVVVACVFHLPKPQKTKYGLLPAGPPDLDKLQRAIGDALTQSGTLTDDSRICEWKTKKYWATEERPPGVKITIFSIAGSDQTIPTVNQTLLENQNDH